MSQFHYGSITTSRTKSILICCQESQFHYGSITTILILPIFINWEESQFHYGSITTLPKGAWTPVENSLNSTMVRLQQSTSSKPFYWTGFSLNSTMVRLQLVSQMSSLLKDPTVSIPLWFDYNLCFSKISIIFFICLNSTMVRLQLYNKRW